MNVDALQSVRTLLKLRGHFHDHVILIQRLVDGRDLPLPKSVVEHGVDVRRGDAQPRSGITIDDYVGFQAFVLLVRVHLLELRKCAHFLQQLGCPGVQLIQILTLKRVLILRLAQTATDLQVLLRLHVKGGARNLGKLLAQLPNDLIGSQLPLSQRFQRDEHASLIHRGCAAAEADHGGDIWVFHPDVDVALHLAAHGVEGDILGSLHRSLNSPGVLLRKETLGSLLKEIDAEASRGYRDHEYSKLVTQNPTQADAVEAQDAVEHLFTETIGAAMLFLMNWLQQLRAHGRRGGKLDHQRHRNRDAQRDREFAEQASDDSAHHENGNEDRDQGSAHRK